MAKQKADISEVRRLLAAGITYRNIAALTGWQQSQISALAQAWGIRRPVGRRPRSEKR